MPIEALAIGASALRLNETRTAVSADNIANAANRSPLDSGAGQASPPVYTPRTVAPVSQQGGGVRPTIQPVTPPYATVPDGAGGTEARPNVDMAQEFVSLNSAARSYESAASVIRTADEMQRTLLDIKG